MGFIFRRIPILLILTGICFTFSTADFLYKPKGEIVGDVKQYHFISTIGNPCVRLSFKFKYVDCPQVERFIWEIKNDNDNQRYTYVIEDLSRWDKKEIEFITQKHILPERQNWICGCLIGIGGILLIFLGMCEGKTSWTYDWSHGICH